MRYEIRKVDEHWWDLPWHLYELTEYRDIFLACAMTKWGIKRSLNRQIKKLIKGEPKIIHREEIAVWETDNDHDH